jgi:hypothetical protein
MKHGCRQEEVFSHQLRTDLWFGLCTIKSRAGKHGASAFVPGDCHSLIPPHTILLSLTLSSAEGTDETHQSHLSWIVRSSHERAS